MNNVKLLVNGIEFQGWKSISITRSIKNICSSFSLSFTDQWNYSGAPWRIKQSDKCEVFIDTEKVITGYVDSVDCSIDSENKSLSVAGRDLTSDLVDCSCDIPQVEFKNLRADKIIEALARPFNIKVVSEVPPGDPFPTWTIQRSETAFENMQKIAQKRGLLLVSNANGELVITTTKSQARAVNAIIQGKNAKEISANYDASKRFSNYKVQTQSSGAQFAEIEDADVEELITEVEGAAKDNVVKRYRPLVIKMDNSGSSADARKRAQWEATIRAAESTKVTALVQGWRQSDGSLWKPNLIAKVESEWCGVNDEMLIDTVEYTLDDSGTVTRFELVPPSSYLTEPTIEKTQAVGLWKELN